MGFYGRGTGDRKWGVAQTPPEREGCGAQSEGAPSGYGGFWDGSRKGKAGGPFSPQRREKGGSPRLAGEGGRGHARYISGQAASRGTCRREGEKATSDTLSSG